MKELRRRLDSIVMAHKARLLLEGYNVSNNMVVVPYEVADMRELFGVRTFASTVDRLYWAVPIQEIALVHRIPCRNCYLLMTFLDTHWTRASTGETRPICAECKVRYRVQEPNSLPYL